MSQKLEYELKGKSDVEQVTGRAKKSVDELQNSFQKAGTEISKKLAGMFSAAVIFDRALNFVVKTVREFGEVADKAEQSGLSFEQWQRLAYAANQSGVSVQSLAKATRQLRTDMAAGAGGDQKMVERFQALGITMEQLKSGDASAVFIAIAAALAGSADESDRLLITTTFFGDKIGSEILPMLSEFKKLQKDIADAPIVDEKTLKVLADYNDKIDRIILKMKVFVATLLKINEFLNPRGAEVDPVTKQIVPGWRMNEIDKEREEARKKNAPSTSSQSKAVLDVISKQNGGKPKEVKSETDKAANTKGSTPSGTASSVSGNVIGVGQNPVVSAIHEQVEIAKQQLDYLRIMATKGANAGPPADLTDKGATPNTPAKR